MGKKLDRLLRLKFALRGSGWLTPDTYGGEYAPLPDDAGVYLLVRYNEFTEPLDVVYVGKTNNLARRLANHQVYKALMKARTSRCWWVQRWFKLFPHGGLRCAAERHFIAFYNPPLNISNRALAHRVTSLH